MEVMVVEYLSIFRKPLKLQIMQFQSKIYDGIRDMHINIEIN